MSKPKRRSQSERRAESERKLIHAARCLFAKQGYLRTTVNQVGEEAGYTGPLVSARFGSKEDLLRAVVRHMTSSFAADQVSPAVDKPTARSALEAYIELYLLEITKRESQIRALYAIMGESISSVPEIRKDVAELLSGMRKRLTNLVARGIESGEFRAEIDPVAAATLIISLLRGTVLQALIEPKEVKVKKLIPLIQRQVILSLE